MGILKMIGKALIGMDEEEKEEQNKNKDTRTPEQIARDEKRAKDREKARKRLEINNRIAGIDREIDELHDKAQEQWNKAKELLRQGQKQLAAELVQAHDETLERIAMKRQKATFFQRRVDKLMDGSSDMEMVSLMKDFAETIGMDMSAVDVQEAFGDIDFNSATVDEIDRVFEQTMAMDAKKRSKTRHPQSTATTESDSFKNLVEEVGGEMEAAAAENQVLSDEKRAAEAIGGGIPAADKSGGSDAQKNAEIDAGLKKITELMDSMNKE